MSKIYKNPTIQRRIENGLCANCGCPQDRVGVTCSDCREKDNIKRKQRYQDKKARGLCTSCGISPTTDGVECDACKEKHKETTNKRRLENNLCLGCGGERTDDHSRCPACRSEMNVKAREKYQMERDAWICRFCGEKSEIDSATCRPCRDKQTEITKAKQIRLVEAGLCKNCRNPIEADCPSGCVCKACHVKGLAANKKNRDSVRRQVLEAYGGVCVGCGERDHDRLAVDHVNNDGSSHRKELGGSSGRLYIWLIREGFPKDRFQILCHNCNFVKHKNGGVLVSRR